VSLEFREDGGPKNRILVDVVDGRNREVRVLSAAAVGSDGECSPRHQTSLELWLLESNGIP